MNAYEHMHTHTHARTHARTHTHTLDRSLISPPALSLSLSRARLALLRRGRHKMADCELDVTDKFLDLRTTTHRLGLHLPYPCDSKNGSAKFVNEKQELQVTLRMMREMDWTRDGPPQ